MILHVIKAEYKGEYKIFVHFNDGTFGLVDLNSDDFFSGGRFIELKKHVNFMNFSVDPELNTIVWANGLDIAPEFLANKMVVSAHSVV